MTYEATGGIRLQGCAGIQLAAFLYYDYEIGSIVFNRHKAARGIYEKVAIKDVRFPELPQRQRRKIMNYASMQPLYIDTFNAYWNEYDLVSYDQAKVLVENFFLDQQEILNDAVGKCLYKPS